MVRKKDNTLKLMKKVGKDLDIVLKNKHKLNPSTLKNFKKIDSLFEDLFKDIDSLGKKK